MMPAALALTADARSQIAAFIAGFSVETTPASADRIADFRDQLRPGTSVYITFLAGADLNATVATAARLRREGFNPVPHIAARSIATRAVLGGYLERLDAEAGVDQVLLIGGAVPTPAGEYGDTMQILETGLLDRHGIKRIGVAGHPEGSPDIPDAMIRHALAWKNEFARRTDAQLYLVTQFCFEAAPIIQWDKLIQAEGNRLPIHIGIPGLATIKTLIGHAKACGIGPSMRFLTKQAMNVARLLAVSAPDRLVADLAAYRAQYPACGIERAHIYPLGGLAKSAQWAYAVADGRFRMNAGDDGFTVAPAT